MCNLIFNLIVNLIAKMVIWVAPQVTSEVTPQKRNIAATTTSVRSNSKDGWSSGTCVGNDSPGKDDDSGNSLLATLFILLPSFSFHASFALCMTWYDVSCFWAVSLLRLKLSLREESLISSLPRLYFSRDIYYDRYRQKRRQKEVLLTIAFSGDFMMNLSFPRLSFSSHSFPVLRSQWMQDPLILRRLLLFIGKRG